jgi:hypothetical protein
LSGICSLTYIKIAIETRSFTYAMFPVFGKRGWEIPDVRPGNKSSKFEQSVYYRTELIACFLTLFLRTEPNIAPKMYVLILILNKP